MPSTPLEQITAVILAGGQSRRMNGRDKAFIELRGQALIHRVIERLRPQVDRIVIAADPADPRYRELGLELLADPLTPNYGPLAGILACLETVSTPYVLTAPCDTPFLPATLATQLYTQLQQSDAQAATVFDGERLHGTLSLLESGLADNLRAWLENGGRQVRAWLKSIDSRHVDFSRDRLAFMNVNTEDDLEHAESMARSAD